MLALLIPSFDTPEAALDWREERGVIVRVSLYLGRDGLIRGVAILRARA